MYISCTEYDNWKWIITSHFAFKYSVKQKAPNEIAICWNGEFQIIWCTPLPPRTAIFQSCTVNLALTVITYEPWILMHLSQLKYKQKCTLCIHKILRILFYIYF